MLLVLDAVARTYLGPSPVHALREASFAVDRGELIGIVGRSGSGKSTLLNVLALLDRPSAGSYRIDGTSVDELSEAEQTQLRSRFFGFVFQHPFLIPRRTAEENVELALLPRGLPPKARRCRALIALEQVGLGHRREAFPRTLSGGEAQRVVIARALAQEPEVLVCDEPTGNLDERTSEEIFSVLKDVNQRGVAVIVATHDLAIASDLARVLTVRDGRVSEVLGSDSETNRRGPILPRSEVRTDQIGTSREPN